MENGKKFHSGDIDNIKLWIIQRIYLIFKIILSQILSLTVPLFNFFKY